MFGSGNHTQKTKPRNSSSPVSFKICSWSKQTENTLCDAKVLYTFKGIPVTPIYVRLSKHQNKICVYMNVCVYIYIYMEIHNYKIKGCQNVAHKKSVKLYCKLVL